MVELIEESIFEKKINFMFRGIEVELSEQSDGKYNFVPNPVDKTWHIYRARDDNIIDKIFNFFSDKDGVPIAILRYRQFHEEEFFEVETSTYAFKHERAVIYRKTESFAEDLGYTFNNLDS